MKNCDSKSPKAGMKLFFARGQVSAMMIERVDDLFKLQFSQPVRAVLAAHGEMPLPPYLGREVEKADTERYQTVYSHLIKSIRLPPRPQVYILMMIY